MGFQAEVESVKSQDSHLFWIKWLVRVRGGGEQKLKVRGVLSMKNVQNEHSKLEVGKSSMNLDFTAGLDLAAYSPWRKAKAKCR